MESILLPTKIEFQQGPDAYRGRAIIEPLYPGYGTTLGNALRRVLLSSLPGAAVTAVKIQNAPHEFTTLPKVQEDVLQIVLNLKQLRVQLLGDENQVKLKLNVKGECQVVAGDIEPDSQVRIINPDLVIATLTSRNAELEMDIWIDSGRGYVPTEAREKEKMEIGAIAIDALYSPVRQVTFNVEPARVGQMTNYDKLVLDILTDGTITPAKAIAASGQLIIDHLALITEQLTWLSVEQISKETPSKTVDKLETNTADAEKIKKKRGRKPKTSNE